MQNLNIGKVIKELRTNKNKTQDELADFLGVSTPAISKWENGVTYPDITLLPTLAHYFNVSIDKIMDYKPNLTDTEIDELIKECESLIFKDINKAIELFEQYLIQYSSDPKLKIRLSEISIMIYSKIQDEQKIVSLNNKLIQALLNVVDSIDDLNIKEKALIQLSSHYMFGKDYKNATKYLRQIHKPSQNPDLILPSILILQKEFDDGRRYLQNSLKKSLDEATAFSWQLGTSYLNKDNLNIDKAINYFEMSIKIKESEDNLLNIGLPYVYLAYSYSQKLDDKVLIDTLNNLIDKMSSFDLDNINKYYDLMNKNNDEFDAKSRFKGVLSLIKIVFDKGEILENNDFKDVIKRIEDKINNLENIK